MALADDAGYQGYPGGHRSIAQCRCTVYYAGRGDYSAGGASSTRVQESSDGPRSERPRDTPDRGVASKTSAPKFVSSSGANHDPTGSPCFHRPALSGPAIPFQCAQQDLRLPIGDGPSRPRVDTAAPVGRGGFVGARRHTRDGRSSLHLVWFLSTTSGTTVHILRDRDSGPVPQLLEFSLQ